MSGKGYALGVAAGVAALFVTAVEAETETVAWWRFEGTPGVQTQEGDTFANSATGSSALSALKARTMNGTTYGYTQTYMPRYTNAFNVGYELYDPLTKKTYANASSLSLRDTLTATANNNNGVATLPATEIPSTGDLTIECFYRAPFLDESGSNVTNRDMIPIICLQHQQYAYGAFIALYKKPNSNPVQTQYYFGYACRTAEGSVTNQSGFSWGSAVADDKWHHVAQVFDFTNHKLKCYVDYQQVDNRSLNTTAVGLYYEAENNFVVGGAELVTSRKFQGHVDEVRITKGALTPSQFLRLRQPASTTDVLTHVSFEKPAWWGGSGFAFASVTNFSLPYFSSASKATAPAESDSVVSSTVYANVNDADGVSNATSCDLNRTSATVGSVMTLDYEAPGATTLLANEPEFTIEFYAKFKSSAGLANYYPIMSDGEYSSRWYFLTNTVTKLCDGSRMCCDVFCVTNANGTYSSAFGMDTGSMSASVCDGNWHHFALRFSTAMKCAAMDIDHGRLAHKVRSLPATTRGFYTANNNLVFGGRTATDRLCDMVVDEVRVTKRFLEDYEFLNTRHLTATERTSATRAWVRFENDWAICPNLGLGASELTGATGSGTTSPAFLANRRKNLLRETASSPTIPNVASASLVQFANLISPDCSRARNLRNATYEAFIKVNAITNVAEASKTTHIFYVGKNEQNPDVGLRVSHYGESTDYAVIVWRNGADSRDTLVITGFNDGLWHHHAITFSETTDETSGDVSTTVAYYRDYELKSSKTVSYARVMSDVIDQTKIGSGATWGQGHDYEIDEIRVSAGVLEPSEFMRRRGLGFGLIFR